MTVEQLAEQTLAVMFFDLNYSLEFPARHGHCPIRHLLLWEWCKDALGDKWVVITKHLNEERKNHVPHVTGSDFHEGRDDGNEAASSSAKG